MPENIELRPQVEGETEEPVIFDISKKLYGDGRAVETEIPDYIEVAREQKIFAQKELYLTGPTLMTLYMAIAAKAAGPRSQVQKFGFHAEREKYLLLWDEEYTKDLPPLAKSLFVDLEPSKVDPDAPTEVLDLRLLYKDHVEGAEVVDSKDHKFLMQQLIAQIRQARERGMTTLRITGFPSWLAQGAAFIAVKEGMTRVIASAPGKEVVVYDQTGEMMGKIENTPPETITVSDPTLEFSQIHTWRDVQRLLEVYLPNNQCHLVGVNIRNFSPQAGLRVCDLAHVVAGGVRIEGKVIFDHQDRMRKDLVPKTKELNPEILSRELRKNLTLDVHAVFEECGGDVEKTALELAKQAVNTALELTFCKITGPLELAAAHAAHGMIDKLYYENDEGERFLIKLWK